MSAWRGIGVARGRRPGMGGGKAWTASLALSATSPTGPTARDGWAAERLSHSP